MKADDMDNDKTLDEPDDLENDCGSESDGSDSDDSIKSEDMTRYYDYFKGCSLCTNNDVPPTDFIFGPKQYTINENTFAPNPPCDNSQTTTGVNSQTSKDRDELARQEEATRLFREITSDPDMVNQALRAAVNPNVARELARQADTAWRNIEAVPGGFRALCQMHHNIQKPLWRAMVGSDSPKVSYRRSSSKCSAAPFNERISVEPMPNPWVADVKPRNDMSGALSAVNSYPLDIFGSSINPPGNSNYNDHSQSSVRSAQQLHSVQSTSMPNVQSSNDAQNAENDPSEKYAKEIAELAGMGINDRYKCLTALEAADGDLFQALGILQSLEELDNEENNN